MKILRILKNNIRDAFKSVVRNFSLSVASITCSAITLIIVALAMILSFNVNNATSELESDLTIEVFLKEGTEQAEIDSIKSQIIDLDNVQEKNVYFVSSEDWRTELMQQSDELEAILSTLETNPLRDSFEVKVDDVNKLSLTNKEIEKIDGVFESKYGEGKAETFIQMFDVIENVMITIVGALVLVTVFLISNTIKLTIFSRKNEIEIMRLVGTSNLVIRLPFIIEGLILGIIGAIIPVIVTVYGYILVYEELGGFVYSNIIPLINPLPFALYISGAIISLGAVVGMFGSYRAVRKYLKI